MKRLILMATTSLLLASTAYAGGDHASHQHGAVKSAVDSSKVAAFDIVASHVERKGRIITFRMETAGIAGSEKPEATGEFAGTNIWAYVWPTSLNPSAVGFEADTGILALAATNHPDFDDTPLFDENIEAIIIMTVHIGIATGLF